MNFQYMVKLLTGEMPGGLRHPNLRIPWNRHLNGL